MIQILPLTKDSGRATQHLPVEPLSKVGDYLKFSVVLIQPACLYPPERSLITGIIQLQQDIGPKSILWKQNSGIPISFEQQISLG